MNTRTVQFASWGLVSAVLLGSTGSVAADDRFAACVDELRTDLIQGGREQAVVERTLADVRYLERIVTLDRSQPEDLQHFSDYLAHRVNAARVRRGQEMLDTYGELFWQIYADYGISPRYLLALWGMETNYGAYFGRVPIVDAMTTLVCDGRRADFFRNQLDATIELLEQRRIATDQLYGSWAGALGHTQFMPTTIRSYAVDYDDSGRLDLRDSAADALASAANYLRSLGWEPGQRWGREVRLDERFDFRFFGLEHRLPVNEWQALGVRRADGSQLPDSEIEASLLLPMGRNGPAFLVYDNFRKFLRWNASESFALAVGHLADRLDGQPPLRASAPAPDQLLKRDEVRQVQRILNTLGYDSGTADGVIGRRTRQAVRDYQQAHDLPADGYPDRSLLEALRDQIGPQTDAYDNQG